MRNCFKALNKLGMSTSPDKQYENLRRCPPTLWFILISTLMIKGVFSFLLLFFSWRVGRGGWSCQAGWRGEMSFWGLFVFVSLFFFGGGGVGWGKWVVGGGEAINWWSKAGNLLNNEHTFISRASNQNGVSLQWYRVEIYHSGWKPSIYKLYHQR